MGPGLENYQNRIIVVYSPGGGNGKSELAANLAFLLARQGLRTWVIDSNTFAPSQDIIFGIPIEGRTFSEFLAEKTPGDIPVYDLSRVHHQFRGMQIALTPARRTDPELRYRVQEVQSYGGDLGEKIPGAVYRYMDENQVDLLIVDTHPGFEQLNEVWLAMTGYLLVVSRLNDIDLENLTSLLHDRDVAEIPHKLVVFNNVKCDANRQASEAMNNMDLVDRMVDLRRQEEFRSYFSDCEDIACMEEGMTEIYHNPFLYSEKLALFGDEKPRDGLFIQKEPDDLFSRELSHLADHILKQYQLLDQVSPRGLR